MPASIRRANTNTTDYQQYARPADQHFSIPLENVTSQPYYPLLPSAAA